MEIAIAVIAFLALLILVLMASRAKIGKSESGSNTSEIEDNSDVGEYQEDIFNSGFPFFYALNNHKEFVNSLRYNKKAIVEELQQVDAQFHDNLQELIRHNSKWRKKSGLPKYLRVLPIFEFIKQGIFVHPDEPNQSEILNSLTMDELKEIANNNDIKAGRSKSETVKRLEDIPIDFTYDDYFKLNPLIEAIYFKDFSNHARNLLREKLENYTLNFGKFYSKQLKPPKEDIKSQEKHGEYFLIEVWTKQNLLSRTEVFFCKGDYVLFSLENGSLDNFEKEYIAATPTGLCIIRINERIDYLISSMIMIVDEDIETVHEDYIEGGLGEINHLSKLSLVYAENLLDTSFWVFDYENISGKILDNPEQKDILSLIEEKF